MEYIHLKSLEGTIDRYYDKVEKALVKQPNESGKMMPLVILVLLCFSIQLARDGLLMVILVSHTLLISPYYHL